MNYHKYLMFSEDIVSLESIITQHDSQTSYIALHRPDMSILVAQNYLMTNLAHFSDALLAKYIDTAENPGTKKSEFRAFTKVGK